MTPVLQGAAIRVQWAVQWGAAFAEGLYDAPGAFHECVHAEARDDDEGFVDLRGCRGGVEGEVDRVRKGG